jgi:LPS sulfotransferase NodH
MAEVFFLLAHARSGSTWLEQTLNAHPDVSCLHEPSNIHHRRLLRWPARLGTWVGRALRYENLVDEVAARFALRHEYGLDHLQRELQKTHKRLSGAKIVLTQLVTHLDFTEFFLRYQSSPFLLLRRASAVDALCSFTIAKRTGIWNSATHRHDELAPFAIESEYARTYMQSNMLYEELVLTYFHRLKIRCLLLSYEELARDSGGVLKRVAAFLGTSAFEVRSPLQKLVTRPYAAIVTNYDELAELEAELKKSARD